MDQDRISEDDVIGFVEFCVGDLEPNSTAHGWFELRRQRHLHGGAFTRIRGHRKARDDHPQHPDSHHQEHDDRKKKKMQPAGEASPDSPDAVAGDAGQEASVAAAVSSTATVGGSQQEEVLRPPPQRPPTSPKKPVPLKNCGRCNAAFAVLRGKPLPGAYDSDDEVTPAAASSLGLNEAAPRVARTESEQMQDMKKTIGPESKLGLSKHVLLGQDQRPNAGELCVDIRWECAAQPDDEWFALCFPRPKLKYFPAFVLNLGELYRDMQDLKIMFRQFFWCTRCVPIYIFSWSCKWLSALALLWWWLFMLRPRYVWQSAFLWPLLILHLLRRERWQKAVLVNEYTAPLSQYGFETVATYGDCRRMQVWVVRLLGSLGLKVIDEGKLSELAAGVARNFQLVLTFKELVDHVQDPAQKWVRTSGKPRECLKGHTLVFLGTEGGEIPGTKKWRCQNPHGCSFRCGGSGWSDATRYSCPTCQIVFCEPCVSAQSRPPAWTKMPTELVPHWLELFLVKLEEPLSRFREAFDLFLRRSMVPFHRTEEGMQMAWQVRKIFLGATVAAYILPFILIGPVLNFVLKTLWLLILLGGSTMFLLELRAFRKVVTYLRASSDLAELQQRRADGPLEHRWAFYTPADHSPSRTMDAQAIRAEAARG